MTDSLFSIKVQPPRPPSPIKTVDSPNLPIVKVTPESVIDLTDSPERTTPAVQKRSNLSKSTTMVNPYKTTVKNPYQKRPVSSSPPPPQTTFIGGAEAARRRAVQELKRKSSSMKSGKATRILRPGEQLSDPPNVKKKNVLSKYMNTFERFFAALFRSTVEEYRASASQSSSTKLWECLCSRLDVTVPTQPVDARYADLVQHCQVRVALILEECRNTVADAIHKIHVQSSARSNASYGRNQPLRLSEIGVQRIEPTSQKASRETAEHSKVTFQKSMTSFTYAELSVIRPGAVFLCSLGGDRSTLGVVVTGNRDHVESTRSFAMMLFRDMELTPHMRVTLIYVTQLVTQYRCFEALTTNYTIHFISHLLGHPPDVPKNTHIRFGKQRVSFSQSSDTSDNSDEEEDDVLLQPTKHRLISNGLSLKGIRSGSKEDNDPISKYFHIPILNATQDEAAQTFLSSKPNTITIVQGPPGTGKTTLLVAILCRYCMEALKAEENGSAPRRRILVSAPTNKAVSLLATRFQKALKEEACNVNVILVGDADKLFSDEGGSSRKRHAGNPAAKKKPPCQEPMLKSIFLYTWMPTIIEGYTRIRTYCLPTPYTGRDTIATLVPLAKQLRQRLTRCLLHLPETLLQRMDEIVDGLESRQSSTTRVPLSAMVRRVELQIKELNGMAMDMVWDQVCYFQ
jgi:AAA domain